MKRTIWQKFWTETLLTILGKVQKVYGNIRVSLIVPCYNEEEGLKRVLPRVPHIVDEVIIVDGSSTDGTVEVAKQFGAKVVTEKRRGYGRAYKTGFSVATGDILATLDGDGTYPAETILEMVQFMLEKEVGFVSGCRFPLDDIGSMSQRNFTGNLIITAVMCVLFKQKFFDGASGMWLLKKEALKGMRLTSNKWNFSLEIKIEAALNPNVGFREYHVSYYERAGKTKVAHPWMAGLKAMLFLLVRKLAIQARKSKRKSI